MPRTPKHKCLIKENTVKCCISHDKKVNKRLSEHSDETGISKSAIAAKAIKEYLENVSKSESDPDIVRFLKKWK